MGRRGSRGSRGREGSEREWVGGCLVPPFFVTDQDEPYRPSLIAWLDLHDDLIIGQEVVGPEDADGALGRTLRQALERPLAGPPRRPDRVRVADPTLVAEIRATLGDDTPIDVAPTPELDTMLRSMLEWMRRHGEHDADESYLEEGRLSADVVAELFRSARVLHRVAPWAVAADHQLLRMDIPALGVDGACVSILGNQIAENRGLLIFPSLDAFEAFGRAADAFDAEGDVVDFGTGWLALTFERGADLPATMRREVVKHGWPVADANAYPRVERYDRDGASPPLVDRDLRVVSACALSLASFFARHGEEFESELLDLEPLGPICESYFDEDGLEVRFTVPYEAHAAFGLDPPGPAPSRTTRPKVGRNEPCPCGSGHKYKKCHLAEDEARRASEREAAAPDDLDAALTRKLGAYAMERFDTWPHAMDDFDDFEETLQLAGPWSLYHYRVEGRTVGDWYLAEEAHRLSADERRWLVAQLESWLSVWEVTSVEPGEALTLRDLLAGEERRVVERTASRSLVVRDALLARVVDDDDGGVSLLCGVHPRPLSPMEAAEVVRRARGRLRRKRDVPVERLRDEAFGRYLIRRWEEAVADLDERAAEPMQLRNTEGDAFLLSVDHFQLAPGARAEVERRLEALESVEVDDANGAGSRYLFTAAHHPLHEGRTLVGSAVLQTDALRLETNSRERADALRARIEQACAGLLHHRARAHVDPLSPRAREAADAVAASPDPPSEEERQALLEFKRRYYRDWVGQSIPALGGRSPREAVVTPEGRRTLDALLKDMENRERRMLGDDAFDFAELRHALGLAELGSSRGQRRMRRGSAGPDPGDDADTSAARWRGPPQRRT